MTRIKTKDHKHTEVEVEQPSNQGGIITIDREAVVDQGLEAGTINLAMRTIIKGT
jgi:hypothetical protein